MAALSANLFGVRARQLLQAIPVAENRSYLSGLLIGDELAELAKGNSPIFLAASEPFQSLHRLALASLTNTDRLILFTEADLDKALLAGQRKILTDHA